MAAGSQASAASASPWGPQTVIRSSIIRFGDALTLCTAHTGTRLRSCQLAALRGAGASASAIRFFFASGTLLTSFRDFGHVDFGGVQLAPAALGGPCGSGPVPVLLNGIPDVVFPGSKVRLAKFGGTAIGTLRRALPGGIVPGDFECQGGGTVLESESPTPGGGQRFVFHVPIAGGPTAPAQTGFAAEFALAFGPDGTLLTVQPVSVCRSGSPAPGLPRITAPACPTGPPQTLPGSVPNPGQTSFNPKHVAGNVLLTLILVLLVPLPTKLFNRTLKENYDRILRPFGKLRSAVSARLGRRRLLSATPVAFLATMVVTSFIYRFLDPSFTRGWGYSITLFLAVMASLVGLVLASDAIALWHMRRYHGERGRFRSYAAALPIAAGCVVVSRLAHFEPGYLLGAIAGFTFAKRLSREEEGMVAARTMAWIMIASLVVWVARTPVHDAAQVHHTFWSRFLDDAMTTLVIAGIEGVVFGMLPLAYLEGEKVIAWSRSRWAVIFGVSLFAFLTILVNPHGNTLPPPNSGSVWSLVGIVAGFTLLSVGMWAYFQARPERRPAPDWGPGPATPTVVAPPKSE